MSEPIVEVEHLRGYREARATVEDAFVSMVGDEQRQVGP